MAVKVSSGEFYFGGDDPQIIVDSVPENRKSIKIEMEILDRKTTEKKFWKVYAEQKRAMEQMSQSLRRRKLWSIRWKAVRHGKCIVPSKGLVMGNILWSVDKNIQ